MWNSLGFHSPTTGEFHIHGVTGPDEYTTVVNDNAFTNLMARRNLRYAVEVVRWLAAERADAHDRLVRDTGLEPHEVTAWERAAEAMHVPYDEPRGIHPQDASFLDKEVWDFANTPRSHYPLLLNEHPLKIYRHQVLKQADVVLAMVLLGDEFDAEQKARNFRYYDPLTTGDSSLSACVQSILAAEIGAEDKALEYFQYALLMDLANVAGNVVDGVHIASVGGVWMTLVYGFAGMSDHDGRLRFDPRLPTAWRGMTVRLRFQDRQLEIALSPQEATVSVLDGPPLTVEIQGTAVEAAPDRPATVALAEVARPGL